MSSSPTGRPKWKRSHHQAERLSSRYTNGETAIAWGCTPLQQEKNKVFILPPVLTNDSVISWSPRLIGTCRQGNKRPELRTAHWQDPPDLIFSNQCASVLSGTVPKANMESSKTIHTQSDETPNDSLYALALHNGTEFWQQVIVSSAPEPTVPMAFAAYMSDSGQMYLTTQTQQFP